MHLPPLFLAALEAGPYISIGKIIPVLVVLLLWARMLSWADKDAVRALLPREILNLGNMTGLILAFVLFLFLPSYAIALPVLIVVMLIEAGAYLGVRHSKVGLKDLKDDWRAWIAGLKGQKAVKVVAGAVTFFDPVKNGALPVPEGEDPTRSSYDAVQGLLTEPLRKGAERLEVKPGDGASQVQFWVDGVAYPAPSLDRAATAAVVAYLKPLAKLNAEEKRKPQSGTMRVQLDGKKKDLEVTTSGSTSGEMLKILVDPKKRHALRLEQLGMLPEQLAAIKNSIDNEKGIVLVAAPRQQGLTSMLYALLRSHDAFLQHIQTIERGVEQDLEGITQNKMAPNASAADESKQVAWTVSQVPDVLMINQIEDPETARQLIDFAGGVGGEEGRRVYVGMRASSTFDALAMWKKLVGDDALALKHVNMIIAGRVMRKLCAACKVAYSPDPDQLRKLNINPANATKLFQARREPLRDPKGNPIPCEFCKELRYHGRFGVYELMIVNDDLRQVVASGGSINQIKAAFRKHKGRLLQEVALAYVEAGDTSLAEVKRVMEAGNETPPPSSRGGGGGPPRPASGPRAPTRPVRQPR